MAFNKKIFLAGSFIRDLELGIGGSPGVVSSGGGGAESVGGIREENFSGQG